ncbi:MAG: SpoIIE family protein phosphatase [Candidatus Aquicultor sp.]
MNKAIGREEIERIVRTIGEGIIIIARDGRLTFINAAAERILDVEKNAVIGKPYTVLARSLTTVDGRPIAEEKLPFARVMRTGKPIYNIEVAFEPNQTKPLGTSPVMLSINAAPLRTETGEIAGVVESFTDITHHVATEKLLRESEERYRRLVEVSPDFIAVISEWRFIYINPAGAKLLGSADPASLIEQPLLSFVHPDYRMSAKDLILRAQRGKVVGPVEEKYIRLNGHPVDVEVMDVPIVYQGKQAVQVIARDITERKVEKERLEKAKELSDALNRINSEMNSTLDFNAIMQRVVKDAAQAMAAETAGIALRAGDYWVTRYVYGLPEQVIGSQIKAERASVSEIAVASRKPVAISDTSTDERVNLDVMEKHGLRAFVVVPLIVRNEIIGLLSFNYYSRPVDFTGDQLDFCSKLATSVSLALENARIYSTERNIADTLQEALLTVPKEVKGIEFGHLYRSATEATKVGGDFYDLFELEHGKVGILIGDVSGKGLEAATLTSLIKNTVRAYAYESDSPAAIVAKANRVMLDASKASFFATMFFCILDVGSGVFTYCSGGHPPAILRKAAPEIEVLETNSPIVGAFARLQYADSRARLEKEDILVLYTDGVTEARCAGGFYGEERLMKAIQEVKHPRAEGLPQEIFRGLIACTKGNLSDDVVILSVSLRTTASA